MKTVVVAAKRTAIGNFGGTLKNTPPHVMAAHVIKAILTETGVEPAQIDEIVLGQVLQAGCGQNSARQAAVSAGIPEDKPAFLVNQVCGSGLQSVILAAQTVKVGDAEIIVAGGMESMSQAPYLLTQSRWGSKLGNFEAVDSMVKDGLTCAINNYHMGITAENIAAKFNVSRREQDCYAAESQQRAAAAGVRDAFKHEIVPLKIREGKSEVMFDKDEYPRPGTTADTLSKLRPAFKSDGSVTAGNSSGLNDGAAVVMLMSAEKASELGLAPLAEIISYASVGVEPSLMGLGPVPATRQALAKANLTIDQIDLFEYNEAFAAQAVAVKNLLELPSDRTNVNGGAIALGHPIGASGARILVTLIHEMRKRQSELGLASLCVGGGQGVAMIIRL